MSDEPKIGSQDTPLRAAKTTNPGKLAGAIAYSLRADGEAHVNAIGATASRVAEEAVRIAAAYVGPDGIEVSVETAEQMVTTGEGIERREAVLTHFTVRGSRTRPL